MGPLLLYGLLALAYRTCGAQNTAVFALLGDGVSLPCPLLPVGSCSRVHWNTSEHPRVTADLPLEVVRAGVVTAPRPPAFRLGSDCSLHIPRLEQIWARSYVCYDDGGASAEVSLKVLQVSSEMRGGDMEIHCHLDTAMGHPRSCPHQGILLEWLREDGSALKNKRFRVREPSKCFSKLIFEPAPTDHRRTWRCRLWQNGTVIATLGHTVNVTDGIEEVFGVVGERVSFSCDTSSLPPDCRAQWAGPAPRGGKGSAPDRVYPPLAVSPARSGVYRCSCRDAPSQVLNTVRLHTLSVSAEREGVNLSLSCELTCGHDTCDDYVALRWTNEAGSPGRSEGGSRTGHTLISKWVVADAQQGVSAPACSVFKDEVLMAAGRWSATHSPPPAVWLAAPLGLLLCAAAAGLYLRLRKRKKKVGGSEAVGIGMAPVYEDIPDLPREKTSVQHNSPSKDGFYDLLQPVE